MKLVNAVLLATVAAGLMVSPSASAVDASRSFWDQGGAACQLSKPTIDTVVRPRATGMRNEGTVNAFVICQYASGSGLFTNAGLYVSTIDGNNHTVSCTAVVGGADNPIYSTKPVDTGTSGFQSVAWFPADFGASTNFGNYLFSVTCTLPAGTSINSVTGSYSEYVGA